MNRAQLNPVDIAETSDLAIVSIFLGDRSQMEAALEAQRSLVAQTRDAWNEAKLEATEAFADLARAHWGGSLQQAQAARARLEALRGQGRQDTTLFPVPVMGIERQFRAFDEEYTNRS